MSFLRKGDQVSRFKVTSRLDSGKRAWREVYLTTTIDALGEEQKCVLVVYDYELTRNAGMMPKSMCPYEVDYMELFDDDSDSRYRESGEFRNRKGREFLYVVYAYVEGERLDKFLKRKSHPKLGVDFMFDLCCAIRDVNLMMGGGGYNALSPRNVIVKDMGNGEYKPYLIDYSHVWKPTKRKKIEGVELLDHRFRAPETFVGCFNELSDIYSLALMFSYILVGETIWESSLDELCGMTEKQRKSVAEKSRLRVLEQVNEEWLHEVLSKALALDSKDRYVSSLHFKFALRKASYQVQEFEGLCDSLLAKKIEEKQSLLDNEEKEIDSGTKDFEKMLDEMVKKQIDAINKDVEEEADKIFIEKELGELPDPFDDMPFMSTESESRVKIEIKKLNGRGFADVAGMASLKQLLKRNFVDIILHKDKAKKYNIKPSNGILLYGPPGCGKTYIAEKIAEEAKLNFVMVKPSDLGSTYIHGSQTKIANLFKKAEEAAPALLCFDEFDTLVPARKDDTNHNTISEVNEFLVQLNNCASRGVYVLAMTNNISLIDTAVLRKGRIDEVIYVSEPDAEARKEIFDLELAKCEMASKGVDLMHLADITRGYTSSDIAYIVMEASREAFRSAIEADCMVEVDQALLEKVISRTSPSISAKELKHYEDMRNEFVNKKKQLEVRPRIGFAV